MISTVFIQIVYHIIILPFDMVIGQFLLVFWLKWMESVALKEHLETVSQISIKFGNRR